jgi:hypothetical protein
MRAPRVSVSLPHKGPMRYIPRFPAVPTRLTWVEDIVNCSASCGAYAEYTCGISNVVRDDKPPPRDYAHSSDSPLLTHIPAPACMLNHLEREAGPT